MFGTLFRVLLLVGLGIVVAGAALLALKAVVALTVFVITLLLPFLVVAWLLRYALGERLRVPSPPIPARERGWRWGPRVKPKEEDPEEWSREASALAAEIAHLVRNGNRGTRQLLSSAPGGARKLAKRVRELSRLWHTLDDHLRTNEATEFLRRAEAMRARADAASDRFVQEQYAEAARSLESQAQTCLELGHTRERLRAEIARILAALTNLRSRIVAVQASPADGSDAVRRAAEELADLEAQVGTFQESVRQVLRQASQPTR